MVVSGRIDRYFRKRIFTARRISPKKSNCEPSCTSNSHRMAGLCLFACFLDSLRRRQWPAQYRNWKAQMEVSMVGHSGVLHTLYHFDRQWVCPDNGGACGAIVAPTIVAAIQFPPPSEPLLHGNGSWRGILPRVPHWANNVTNRKNVAGWNSIVDGLYVCAL